MAALGHPPSAKEAHYRSLMNRFLVRIDRLGVFKKTRGKKSKMYLRYLKNPQSGVRKKVFLFCEPV
jgi:hypothetical protein